MIGWAVDLIVCISKDGPRPWEDRSGSSMTQVGFFLVKRGRGVADTFGLGFDRVVEGASES